VRKRSVNRPCRVVSIKFGRLAAEYGIYHYRSLADWATWALERIERSEVATIGEAFRKNPDGI
jgi:hypothetical protein